MNTVSCITVCRNCKEDLKITLDSMLLQEFKDFDVLVVDGDSNDGTKDILPIYQKKFADRQIEFHYISEPDTGIYNAMNKGIGDVSGEWTIFMNAGDVFADQGIMKRIFINTFDSNVDVIYGDYKIKKYDEIKVIKSKPMKCMEKMLITCHQSIFTKTILLKKRKFEEKCEIMADFSWYIKLYCNNGFFYYIPESICVFDGNGLSSTNKYRAFCECMEIRKVNGTLNNPAVVIKAKKIIMFVIAALESLYRRYKEWKRK